MLIDSLEIHKVDGNLTSRYVLIIDRINRELFIYTFKNVQLSVIENILLTILIN